MEPLLTMKQASEAAGVSRRTIQNWMTNGKLPFVRTLGGSPRFKASDLFVPSSGEHAYVVAAREALA